jgi:adenylate cyclase
LVAIWSWAAAIRHKAVLRAVDAMFQAVERNRDIYERLCGRVPSFRIGIHGGDVVVSEHGDTKRSIGIYGDAINIATRMEEAAKAHNVCCIVSNVVADEIGGGDRLRPIGEETVKGISAPVRVCEYRPMLC